MKIDFILTGLGTSGGAMTLYQWADRLAAESHDVRLLAARSGPGSRLVSSRVKISVAEGFQNALHLGARAVARALGSGTADRALKARMIETIRRPDSVEILGFLPLLPHLTTGRGPAIIGYAQHWEPLWCGGAADSLNAMRAQIPLIVNSSWLANRVTDLGGPSAPKVFPGVEPNISRPDGLSRNSATCVRVAALGRDEPFKGLADLRKALGLLGSRNIQLLLFGTPRRGRITRDWGQEHHLGYLAASELADLYSTSDMVVCPSWLESFPLPPLEAMAAGAPVVTTRIGTEDYAFDGENCLVVPPRAPDLLSAALDTLISSSTTRESLRAAGLETARRFTWESGYRRLKEVLCSFGVNV